MFYRRPLFAGLALAAAAAPVHGAALHENLIENPGAELGAVSSSEGDTSQSIVGWENAGGHVVILTHEGKFDAGDLDPDPENPFDRGDNFFFGGRNQLGIIEQDIDVSSLGSEIDTGQLTFALSGWLGGYQAQNDRMELEAVFQDTDDNALSSATIGPVTDSDRNNTTGFLYRAADGSVPVGTRSVQLTLRTFPWEVTNNDGMADDLSLVFVPEPGTLALFGAGAALLLVPTRRKQA